MRRGMRCVLFGIALLVSAHVRAGTALLKTQPGSVVHWSRAVITVGIDPAASSATVADDDVLHALALATQTWNAVPAGQPRFDLASGPPPDVSIRFCRGRWRGDTIDLGRSSFTASLRDGSVTAATVEMNECDHRFASPEQHTGYDLQAVLTHELGHVLGLGHSTNTSAIMYPSGGGSSVRAPHVEDQTALALIYFGRAGTESISSSASPPPRKDALPPAVAAVNVSLQGGTMTPPREATALLPPDSVSLLSFKTRRGRSVMVYTCEPTLLPPIDLVENPGRASKPSRPTKGEAAGKAR